MWILNPKAKTPNLNPKLGLRVYFMPEPFNSKLQPFPYRGRAICKSLTRIWRYWLRVLFKLLSEGLLETKPRSDLGFFVQHKKCPKFDVQPEVAWLYSRSKSIAYTPYSPGLKKGPRDCSGCLRQIHAGVQEMDRFAGGSTAAAMRALTQRVLGIVMGGYSQP